MSTKIPKTLTTNAISLLGQYDCNEQNVYVQLIGIEHKSNIISCKISDGSYSCKAFISLENNLTLGYSIFISLDYLNSVIKITAHFNNAKGIVIGSYQHILFYKNIIGKPIDFKEANQNKIANNQSNIIQMEIQKQQKISNKQNNTQKKIKKMSQIQNTQPSQKVDSNQQCNQTIKTLYPSLSKWQILCRILKKDYKQIEKQGKIIKILSMELIDRSNMKISGTFFGQEAVKRKQLIKQGSVYQISYGQIRLDNYNNTKTSAYSPYSIVFGYTSVFNQVSDVNLIAKNQDIVISLGDLINQKIFSKDLDVAAMLIEIKDQMQIPSKDNTKTLKKRNIVICDPQKHILMNATIWNNKVQVDSSLIGKTVLLSNFKLHQYMESLSLNSSFKSEIKLLTDHKFKYYEGRIQTDGFNMVSDNRKQTPDNDAETYKTIKDLENAANRMQIGDILKSDLNVWVSRFATRKKWYYDGCTRCNRGVQAATKCQKCNIIVEVPAPHYAMGVQLSDINGSIWATAMDQFANRIFDISINHLKSLNEETLSDLIEKYLFKQFKLKIITKKDNQGRVKHNISKIYDFSYQKQSKYSLEAIKMLMGTN